MAHKISSSTTPSFNIMPHNADWTPTWRKTHKGLPLPTTHGLMYKSSLVLCYGFPYSVNRSSQLRRLEIACYFRGRNGIWSEPFKKLSSLEELSLVRIKVRVEYIEAAGRCCPLLKTLKVNQKASSSEFAPYDYYDFVNMQNEIALAIGKNLPQLTHLELIGSSMDNIGLQAILDGCCHLESLDLSLHGP
ncbi:putative leucine-rich repeat domain superfamily [Helianthus debilis subsp. tardiflorus]